MSAVAPIVPDCVATNTTPLHLLEAHLLSHQTQIETWFRQQWRQVPPPFYASVDLRNAGFKLAPVDTNLFPAGFNNLNTQLLPLAYHALQAAISRLCPDAGKILLVPENHTRNTFYLESVATLVSMVTQAGYAVRVGSLRDDITAAQAVTLPSGRVLTLYPLQRKDDRVFVEDFYPCAVLLNNDLSSGQPEILQGIKQEIIPPLTLGWDRRLKSNHFTIYRDVARQFAELIDIDPWLIDPLMRNCGCIDFMKRTSMECIERNVEELLVAIQAKYAEYKIDKPPFVFIKADSGSYGMGVMTVSSVAEVQQLNRKQRTRMDSTKEGRKVQKVIIQEGVYTSETVDANTVAEPVIYMIDQFVVGGFYRAHSQKDYTDNLNSPGMHFVPLPFTEPCNAPDPTQEPDALPNRFYAYGVIARLALLAAAREIQVA